MEIDDLRARWEAERSPGLTLQLAERYRESGAPNDALAVLEDSLAREPHHAAARVAKGRCHLDLGQVVEAIRELGTVAQDDPAHLWANQLLAEAHLEAGELARARDRVDLVALLGGDTAGLDERIASAASAAAGETIELEVELPPADGLAEATPTSEAPTADAAPSADEPSHESPFELPQPVAPQGLTVEPQEPTAARGQGTTPVAVYGEGDPFQLGDFLQLDATGEAAPLLGPEPAAEPVPEPPVEAGAPEGAVEATPEDDAAATLTLAELYRRQGHPEEAASIFREILERQPGNADAARALGELEKGQSWPLSADDLLGGNGEADGDSPAGEVLRRYRDRLRGKE